jgi:hypothetical protein
LLDFNDVVAAYRSWYGWMPARGVRVPPWLMESVFRLGDLAGRLGWRPPIRTTAQKELLRGAVGDPGPWTAMTGIVPRSLERSLAMSPASVQERWFAKLYLLKPVVLTVLSLFWIVTGLISLGPGALRSCGTAMSPVPPRQPLSPRARSPTCASG